MYHSRLALCGSISARAIRDRDLHHVHAFSDQLIDVAQFFRPGHRICDSWLQRVRRYIAQSAHHRIQRSCQTRPNDRFILSHPRFDSQCRRNPWRMSVETWASTEFSRSSRPWSSWNNFLHQNDSPKPTVRLNDLEKELESGKIARINNMSILLFRIAAVLCFLAVALGAFGAHGLRSTLEGRGMVNVWDKAVFYHFIHAIALLVLALYGTINRGACLLLLTGILLFSGGFYLSALTNP